jgi:hypothetical protein
MADLSKTGIEGLVEWLRKYQPALLARVGPKLQQMQLSGLGLVDDASTTSTFADTLKQLLTTGASVYLTKTQLDAQKRIIDLQVARAQQGLPPLDIDPTTAGVPNFSVGVSKDTKTLALWLGGGLAAVILVSSLMGSRRSRSRR